MLLLFPCNNFMFSLKKSAAFFSICSVRIFCPIVKNILEVKLLGWFLLGVFIGQCSFSFRHQFWYVCLLKSFRQLQDQYVVDGCDIYYHCQAFFSLMFTWVFLFVSSGIYAPLSLLQVVLILYSIMFPISIFIMSHTFHQNCIVSFELSCSFVQLCSQPAITFSFITWEYPILCVLLALPR